MPINHFDANEIQEYLNSGVLNSQLVISVLAMHENSKRRDTLRLLTIAERRLYDRVIRDIEEISNLLETLRGAGRDYCSLNEPYHGNNGYQIERVILFDHNVLNITKTTRPDFYWRVAIRDDGTPEHRITGFYHGCSSGSLRDIIDAFENTRHLFPAFGFSLAIRARTSMRHAMA